MENRYRKLKKDLDDLGFHHTLSVESIPLVERLVDDLKTTTEGLQKFMNIAKQAIDERDTLELGAEPYRCDNAKLVRECNELHSALLQYKEQNERIQKDFKRKVLKLESDKKHCDSENFKYTQRVRDLERQLNKFITEKRREQRTGIQSKLRSSSTSALLKEPAKKATTFELNSAMALADQKIACLGKEIKKLKEQQIELVENNEMYRCQMENRDREIRRLKDLLEGGRPLNAINKDCCYKNVDGKFHKMQDDINVLKREKSNLENRLKDTLAKQHEAMKRALHLADRNKHLEKELQDIDRMALQVEADCNSSIKCNAEKVNRLQDRMQDAVLQIQNLEREKTELKDQLEVVKQEKCQLQATLESCLEDKKQMTDKFNNFTIIEHDLNMEIDRLVQLTSEQKRRIAELENNLITDKATEAVKDKYPQVFDKGEGATTKNATKKKPIKKKAKSPTKPKTSSKPPNNSPQEKAAEVHSSSKGCCDTDGCVRHFKDLLDKEIENRQKQSDQCIEALKKEKDYYVAEYHRLVEDLKNVPSKSDNNAELILKLNEKEEAIQSLRYENKVLSEEKYNLMSRLESARDSKLDNDGSKCLKPICKRMDREREILRADLQKLEEERDYLKQQINCICENSGKEIQELQQLLRNSENEIRKLEQDKRELLQTQGSRRSNLNSLENQMEAQREEFRTLQCELTHQRTMYNQLKNLHQQADKALSDTQAQLMQVESELCNALEKIKYFEREKDNMSQGESTLKYDIQVLKKKLSQIDKEKDELVNCVDEKTEQLAVLKEDLSLKNDKINSLEATINDLKKQLSKSKTQITDLEHRVNLSKADIETLNKDLDTASRLNENMAMENRRLQDNVSVASVDCRDTRNELEIAKRQIEDLKRQLQTYVAEVKRTEDLISQKEIERNELLDQFRNLSQEANVLETNNHTLENEATQTKVQLSVALDHAGELERKLLDKDALIRGYEKQISEMTGQIASLEFSSKQYGSKYDLMQEEVKNLKDLCVKLDNEKDALKREMLEKGDQKIKMDRSIERMRLDYDKLKNSISKDQNNIETLEKLLCDARQEAVEHKLLNEELQSEIRRLKSKYEEIRDKLSTSSAKEAQIQTDTNYNKNTKNYNEERRLSPSVVTSAHVDGSTHTSDLFDDKRKPWTINTNQETQHINSVPTIYLPSTTQSLYTQCSPSLERILNPETISATKPTFSDPQGYRTSIDEHQNQGYRTNNNHGSRILNQEGGRNSIRYSENLNNTETNNVRSAANFASYTQKDQEYTSISKNLNNERNSVGSAAKSAPCVQQNQEVYTPFNRNLSQDINTARNDDVNPTTLYVRQNHEYDPSIDRNFYQDASTIRSATIPASVGRNFSQERNTVGIASNSSSNVQRNLTQNTNSFQTNREYYGSPARNFNEGTNTVQSAATNAQQNQVYTPFARNLNQERRSLNEIGTNTVGKNQEYYPSLSNNYVKEIGTQNELPQSDNQTQYSYHSNNSQKQGSRTYVSTTANKSSNVAEKPGELPNNSNNNVICTCRRICKCKQRICVCPTQIYNNRPKNKDTCICCSNELSEKRFQIYTCCFSKEGDDDGACASATCPYK